MPLVYLSLDDYNIECLDRRAMEALDWLRVYFPNFKINLLASSGLDIPENKYPDKYAYLLHGWRHEHYDTLTDSALDLWPFDKVYKAPFWELPNELYERLIKHGYKVMLLPDDYREGIKYNWDIKDQPDLDQDILIGHGHITSSINYIADRLDNILMLPQDTEFGFIRNL